MFSCLTGWPCAFPAVACARSQGPRAGDSPWPISASWWMALLTVGNGDVMGGRHPGLGMIDQLAGQVLELQRGDRVVDAGPPDPACSLISRADSDMALLISAMRVMVVLDPVLGLQGEVHVHGSDAVNRLVGRRSGSRARHPCGPGSAGKTDWCVGRGRGPHPPPPRIPCRPRPARAASMAALRASRLVCLEMASISPRMPRWPAPRCR
jgi:hypothetical protein